MQFVLKNQTAETIPVLKTILMENTVNLVKIAGNFKNKINLILKIKFNLYKIFNFNIIPYFTKKL